MNKETIEALKTEGEEMKQRPFHKSTAWAFMHGAENQRSEVARDIELLKGFTNTEEYIKILVDIELRLNDLHGLLKKEYEVLEHAESKNES